ncbi:MULTISPECIES: metallophosphoesterase [Tenacibaculum]|uniref:Serine/threonine protein phosphatase n=1 Tax=Tenacibaculum aiptasiae TaxID=426481 RepID=A0A7J5ASU2_9FLAO|nr:MULTISPECIES: metallophosphoesterase [Tenacibaculum]KAB1160708.1 serine/threonine protein phosphatase [Tenacibaculum aiptasiae]MCF2874568.1 metallophosphoesterase [Tenacibaculum sp. Cn5-1]MCF2934366.1 metallophosphoesterase [Tenacibaculum sp. Cn5-34]MCG7510576.1 metallophosphoesterase [Tenacibaculum sp. Cn5-46]
MSSNSRITRAFKNAKKLELTEQSKYVLFSDCHRGDNSFADDFSHNRKIFHYALSQYLQKDFTYIELGDGDELWENKFANIFNANKDVYLLLREFHKKNHLHFIWGNHDMDYRNPKKVAKNLDYYYDTVDGKNKELLKNASFSEAIRLEQEDGKSIFLLHGHQADWFNYNFWKLSRFLVKILWRPLQLIGIDDPTSPAKNFKELIKVESRLEEWIQKNNNQMIVTGHTHRPRFPSPNELPHFNDGSCVHPRCITGLEIENQQITLIKWHVVTNEDGTMQISRTILEGPENLSHYI